MKHVDENSMLYLCREEVELICRELDSVALIRDVFAFHGSHQTILPDEAYLSWTNEKGEQARSLNMPGYVGGSFHMAGTKIINSNPSNLGRDLPRASGLILLYDTLTARILCVMEGAFLSSLRTASVTALAIDLLQGNDVESLALIGAGAQAQAHLELLVKRFPHLKQILLFDLDMERAKALQRRVKVILQNDNINTKVTSTAEEAIRSSKIIVTTTTITGEGYIHFAWLQRGALLVNVSLDDPLPEVVLQADKIIVDDWHLVKNDSRRLLGRMYRARQIIGPSDPSDDTQSRRVDAQLGDLVLGKKIGRDNNSEIILVNPFGLAIEDVAFATHVYRKAQELGFGVVLNR